jgi:uncharacterized membrane protein
MFENSEQPTGQSDGVTVSSRMFSLLLLGFLLVFVGIIVLIVASIMSSGGSGSFGGVIFIGPIPIVFGAGPDSNWLIIISIIIAVIMVAFFAIYMRRARRINY